MAHIAPSAGRNGLSSASTLNRRLKIDHVAHKPRLRSMRGFLTLAGAKAPLIAIGTFCTIHKGQFENCETGVINEIDFVARPFSDTA
ncbi:hypothetical protein [Thioclava sp.]|uniref:hypothetical protein n=1 Tax=Thioclava sp. TaxID=1933450 RepID=UPI003AA8F3F0